MANGGEPGILADDDSPGNILERETEASKDTEPLWGQTGSHVIDVHGVKTRIDMEGIFGLAAHPIPGFAIHAVEYDKPFFSETGYRSFLGFRAKPAAGMTTGAFAAAVIGEYIRQQKGKVLRSIEPRYCLPARENGL